MTTASKTSTEHKQERKRRERLRAQGLRPIRIWVPDTRDPAFAEEAHRQSLAVAQSAQEADDQAFIDSISTLAVE